MVARCLMREVYRHQDLAMPSLDSWATAKEAYARIFQRAISQNPIEYTWREVGSGLMVGTQVLALYYIGRFMGRTLQAAF